jgi:hypothetical protein
MNRLRARRRSPPAPTSPRAARGRCVPRTSAKAYATTSLALPDGSDCFLINPRFPLSEIGDDDIVMVDGNGAVLRTA